MAYQPPVVYQQGGAYPYAQQQQQPPPQQQYQGQQQPYPYQQAAYPYPQQPQQQQPGYGYYAPAQPAYGYYAPQPGYNMPPPGAAPAPGRKKALLVGCCYPGTSAALNGCINDVQCVKYCLEQRFGFTAPGCIVMLTDDQSHPDYTPTRANILRGMQWLMQDQRPGDSLFFHFSGHGSQQTDYSGDELDGQDETILPTDHATAGQIVDDELNEALVQPLAPGVMLHCLMDCCHSGTAMDLPYRIKAGLSGRFEWKLKSRVIKGTSGGTAFQIGACKDSQTAADTNAMSGSAYTGAATYSFLDALESYGTQQTYANLLQHMMESLKKQGGGGPSTLGSAAGSLAGIVGGVAGGMAGQAAGMLASFVLGPAAMGGQVPVLCCDKQVDIYSMQLAI